MFGVHGDNPKSKKTDPYIIQNFKKGMFAINVTLLDIAFLLTLVIFCPLTLIDYTKYTHIRINTNAHTYNRPLYK